MHVISVLFHARDTAQEITILHYVAQPAYFYSLFKKSKFCGTKGRAQFVRIYNGNIRAY